MMRTFLLIGFLMSTIDATCDYIFYPEVQQAYKFFKTPQKWFDARETCRKEGANLAMPKNAAEASVLKKIFAEYPVSVLEGVERPDYCLLGFHDIFREGEFVDDEGDLIRNYFSKCYQDQLNDGFGGEHCGSFNRQTGLSDFQCYLPGVFICQKNKEKAKINITSYEYSEQTKKFYKLHLNAKTWPKARVICKDEGGNLAIINNKAEEDFLVAMLKKPENKVDHALHIGYALLGFHDLFRENHFVTVEGDDFSSIGYARWADGEPSNSGNLEHCGSVHISGGINDLPCNNPVIFFCEIGAK